MILNFYFPGKPHTKQSVRMAPVYNKDGEPVTFKNKKTGKNQVLLHKHQSQKVKENEASLQKQIREQLPEGFKPTEKPVIVRDLIYCFPPISNLNKQQKQIISDGGMIYKYTIPDLTDNLNKGLFDAMAGLVYLNDSRIISVKNARKVYGSYPGIYATLQIIGYDLYAGSMPDPNEYINKLFT